MPGCQRPISLAGYQVKFWNFKWTICASTRSWPTPRPGADLLSTYEKRWPLYADLIRRNSPAVVRMIPIPRYRSRVPSWPIRFQKLETTGDIECTCLKNCRPILRCRRTFMTPAPIKHAPKNLSECGSDGIAASSPIVPARIRKSRTISPCLLSTAAICGIGVSNPTDHSPSPTTERKPRVTVLSSVANRPLLISQTGHVDCFRVPRTNRDHLP
jgi:hypothetical protein